MKEYQQEEKNQNRTKYNSVRRSATANSKTFERLSHVPKAATETEKPTPIKQKKIELRKKSLEEELLSDIENPEKKEESERESDGDISD